MTPQIYPSEVDRLTREIHILEAHATERATSAIEFKIQIGRRLNRAKEVLPFGTFLAWALEEFGWSRMHVARHMALARNVTRVGHLPPEASLRAALAAIAAAGRDTEPSPTGATPPRYVLTLAWRDGKSIDLAVRPALAEQLIERDLATATLCVIETL